MRAPPGQPPRGFGADPNATSTPPAPQPEVIMPGEGGYRHPAPDNGNQYLSIFPEFTGIARATDSVARRFPWWLWLLVGAFGYRWLNKRGGVKILG